MLSYDNLSSTLLRKKDALEDKAEMFLSEFCKRTKLLCLLCLASKNHRMESYWRGEKTEVQHWCSGSVGSKCTLTFTSAALIYRQGGG